MTLRVFKTYRFIVPNKIDFRELTKEFANTFDYKKLVFEVYCLDDITIEKEKRSTEELIPLSKTLKKYPELIKYAYAQHEKRFYFTEMRDGQPIHDKFIDTKLCLSNLDDTWEDSNPKNDVDPLEFADFCKTILKLPRSHSYTTLTCFDGISWFGETQQATYGYDKAKSAYCSYFNYLSSFVAVSVIGYENKYSIIVGFEVTPSDGTDTLQDESEHIDKLIKRFGKPRSIRTYYAPKDEADRDKWDLVRAKLEEEHKKIAEFHDSWIEALPHQLVDDEFYRMEGNTRIYLGHDAISSETRKIMQKSLKGTKWHKGTNVLVPGHSYFTSDDHGTIYELWFDIAGRGHILDSRLYVYAKMFEKEIQLERIEFVKTDNMYKFYENALIMADKYTDALTSAYEKVLTQTDTLSYFNPKIIK